MISILTLILTSIKVAFNPILYILEEILSDGEESFITQEGWEMLNDPIKKEKLNNYIENWKQTGIWNEELLK
jgi:hypothetical protein